MEVVSAQQTIVNDSERIANLALAEWTKHKDRADQNKLYHKARALRERVAFTSSEVNAHRWEFGSEEDRCTADLLAIMDDVSEATRIERYLECLKNPHDDMWRCIVIDRERKAAKPETGQPNYSRPTFVPDRSMGFAGQVARAYPDRKAQQTYEYVAPLKFK